MTDEEKKEKAEELAATIKKVNDVICDGAFFPMYDVAFAEQAYIDMRAGAERYDTMAALNFRYNPDAANVMRIKAEALNHLTQFVKLQIQASTLEGKRKRDDAARENLSNILGL